MDWITQPESWVALITLTALELVLGIDNIVFISILAGKVPAKKRKKAWRLGLGAALITRIALLFSISWIIRLTAPLFQVFGNEISARDLFLIAGGLFLLGKSTWEIHQKLEGHEGRSGVEAASSFASVIVQIMLIDVVFSIDSVITAVGMVQEVAIMIAAVTVAVGLMMVFATTVGDFVERHPTVKMLALSFLLLIGMALVADGLDHHIPKGYIYFAMGFSVFVESLNSRLRGRLREPVEASPS